MTPGAELPPPTLEVDEILVTAQKRSERLQDVPISVVALSGEHLQSLFAAGDDVLALATRVPGLYAESSNGRAAPRFYLRGLGNSDFDIAASQPVSVIMDEVVLEEVNNDSSRLTAGRIMPTSIKRAACFGRLRKNTEVKFLGPT